jgi:hypothetical protein
MQGFIMPKKSLAEGKESLLTEKWICPIHAEPVQNYLNLYSLEIMR